MLDDPYDDPEGLEPLIPDRSPEPTKEQLDVSIVINILYRNLCPVITLTLPCHFWNIPGMLC